MLSQSTACVDCGRDFVRPSTPGRPRRRCLGCRPDAKPLAKTGNCIDCGVVFSFPARAKPTSRCGECRRQWNTVAGTARRHARSTPRTCRVCSKEIPLTAKSRAVCLEHRGKHLIICEGCGESKLVGLQAKRFCSQQCAGPAVGGLNKKYGPRPCAWCGTVFPNKRGVPTETCGVECSRALQAKRASARAAVEIMCPLNWRACVDCGDEWLEEGRAGGAFRCSPCRLGHKRRETLAYYYRVIRPRDGYSQRQLVCTACGAEFSGHGGRAYCDACPDVRAAVYKQAPERIDMATLVQRDKRRCWLCTEYVRDDERTIDHVWPIAKGGQHIWSNVRLAHRRCNSAKRDRLVTAQLGML
jgi:hypothetical protein